MIVLSVFNSKYFNSNPYRLKVRSNWPKHTWNEEKTIKTYPKYFQVILLMSNLMETLLA